MLLLLLSVYCQKFFLLRFLMRVSRVHYLLIVGSLVFNEARYRLKENNGVMYIYKQNKNKKQQSRMKNVFDVKRKRMINSSNI